MDPFSIAPYEMWEAILDRLEDPQDKLYLVRTNSTLENAFRSKIALWQLLAALPVLASHNLDLQYRRLNSAIRKCRRISQECCKAVDRLIDIHWEKFDSLPPFAVCRYELYYPDDFQRFWRKAQNHPPHRSPLLGKSLGSWFSVNDEDDDMNDDDGVILMRFLRDFLAKFGRNLKRMRLEVDLVGTGSIERQYRFFADSLAQTPNIESLMMYMPCISIAEEIVLPPLVSLQRLDIHLYTLPGPCQGHSLNFHEYFPQLTHLRFSFDFWKEQYNVKGLFPNLKSVRLYTYLRFVGPEEKVYKFYKNLDAPKLEELQFNYKYYSFMMTYTMPQKKEFDNSVNFFKETGLIFLRNLHPKCKWMISERRQRSEVTILFNRNVNSVSLPKD